MANNTKQKIIDAAFEIFARDGYAGTNIKDIAESVGIVKSALYRHFDSKEAIWEAVIDSIADHYNEHVGSASQLPPIPSNTDELYKMTMGIVNFTIHDPQIIQARKILTTEQYRNEKAKECASSHFLYRMEDMFTGIFSGMIENGIIKKCDPKVLAFSYTTPITALIHHCDRDSAYEAEVMEMLELFIQHFINEYKV